MTFQRGLYFLVHHRHSCCVKTCFLSYPSFSVSLLSAPLSVNVLCCIFIRLLVTASERNSSENISAASELFTVLSAVVAYYVVVRNSSVVMCVYITCSGMTECIMDCLRCHVITDRSSTTLCLFQASQPSARRIGQLQQQRTILTQCDDDCFTGCCYILYGENCFNAL